MAKTRQLSVRTVKTKKDRNTGGFFTRLKTDEWLKAHALFTPDPEAAKNPGYYEYFEHYDKTNNLFVPCAGDDCYMCELGDNPSGRAITLLYFPENPEKEKFKILKLNGFMIRDFGEIEEEEGGVLGRYFRIKRLDDNGKYRVSVSTDRKKLTSAEVKALLKEAAENKMDLPALTMNQLRAALKKVEGVNALSDDDDDDDDEDEETTTKARKGKEEKKSKAKDEDEDETDDDDEDEEDEADDEEDEDEDENEDEDEEDEDEDGDDEEDEEDSDDSDEEDEDESGEATELKGVEVVNVSEKDETVTVKIDGKSKKMWCGDGFEIDFEKVKKGVTADFTVMTDDEGDYIITGYKVKKAKAETKEKGKKTKK